ncbi:hypothetical protein Tco_0688233 [Tanacetum coccineum]
MVYVVNGVLASGVDMVLEKDFAGFALQEMEIHPLMLLIRTLSMILQMFSPTLHNPSMNHTRVNYVGTTLIMVMIVHHGYRLSMSRNRATIKTLESTIPLNEIISQIPPSIAITTVLSTMEPEDSLIMWDEGLSTIPEKESDEVIKSSIEDLVPIPSESEDTSDSDKDDDESLPEEDVSEENFKIYLNPLFEFDEEYISSDINPLFNEVLEDIENKDSYELTFLVTPLSDVNKDKCFDPGGGIDEIDAFLDIDVPTDIKDGYHDSEGDIIYLRVCL